MYCTGFKHYRILNEQVLVSLLYKAFVNTPQTAEAMQDLHLAYKQATHTGTVPLFSTHQSAASCTLFPPVAARAFSLPAANYHTL